VKTKKLMIKDEYHTGELTPQEMEEIIRRQAEERKKKQK